MTIDYSLLQMALIGYKAQRQMIDEKLADIQKLLGDTPTHPSMDGTERPTNRLRRPMSTAAKRRIALAQKKRWKAFRAEQKKAK